MLSKVHHKTAKINDACTYHPELHHTEAMDGFVRNDSACKPTRTRNYRRVCLGDRGGCSKDKQDHEQLFNTMYVSAYPRLNQKSELELRAQHPCQSTYGHRTRYSGHELAELSVGQAKTHQQNE